MSSPAARRSQRNSLSATPARSNRNSLQPPSSPVAAMAPNQTQAQAGLTAASSLQRQSQGTPRASQHNIASSSPLFFRSSPANGTNLPNANDGMEISSPLRQAPSMAGDDNTPRGRAQPPHGMLILQSQVIFTKPGQRFLSYTLRFKLEPYTGCKRTCPSPV